MEGNQLFRRARLFILTSCCIILNSCQVPDYLYYNFADLNDYKIFPSISVSTNVQRDSLPCSLPQAELILPEGFAGGRKDESFGAFLDRTKTVAFLIIRNDSIVYQHYGNGYSGSSIIPSFSVAKSVVSALLGIAIHEGYIRSVDQPVTDFLPGLKDPGFRNVTLQNLLEMRSGIKYDEGYMNPFGSMAKFYYGDNLRKYTFNLKVTGTPGGEYDYQSCNTELLAMAIEHAVGKKLPVYLEEKIWQPMHMEYDATWSVDSKKDAEVKAFCCINARAVDFAKFGILYLNRGIWGSDTIVPPSWVDESLKISNNSIDSQGYPYAYHWRVLTNGDFFAKGVLGQFIYVSPSRNVVIVRMGKSVSDIVWARLFTSLTGQL
jgi:CubicO group peptidase (beta-lactamase class C family)